MSSIQQPPSVAARVHPVHGFAGAALAAVRRVADAPAWALSPAEQAETLVELTRLQAAVAELRLRVLAVADTADLGSVSGATSTAAWLAHATQQTRKQAHADVRLARALADSLLAPTRAALAAAQVNVDQAWVVVRMVEDLRADDTLTDAQRVHAQQHLIGEAGSHDARALRVLAGKIFEVLAPEEAERREGAKLEDEERKARHSCRFTTRDNHDGTVSGSFKLPTAQAQMLLKAVHAFAAPRRQHHPEPGPGLVANGLVDPEGRPIPWSVQLGQAFAELVEHLPTTTLPRAGGLNAAVLVTLTLDRLTSGLGAAVLDTGTVISAGQARRLACNAGLVPVVLGGASEPLDVGREQRLHTPAMRKARIAVDPQCTTDGCDRPAAWCEFHHSTPFARGGPTSAANARMLCPRHHHYAHDTHYDMRELPNGQVRFHKRT
jgi:hypothetical protein